MAIRESGFNRQNTSLGRKLWQIHWLFVLLVCATAGIGVAMLFSAANGSFDPWASRQTVRFAVGLGIMVVVAVIDIRLWFKYAYVFYFSPLPCSSRSRLRASSAWAHSVGSASASPTSSHPR